MVRTPCIEWGVWSADFKATIAAKQHMGYCFTGQVILLFTSSSVCHPSDIPLSFSFCSFPRCLHFLLKIKQGNRNVIFV